LGHDEDNGARPMGELKRRCRLRNHIYSRKEVKKIKNHK
jgi:hypothetical protein